MAVDFTDFTTSGSFTSDNYLVGYDTPSSGGEKKWKYDTLMRAVSASMNQEIVNKSAINVVDSSTVDLNWNASTRTLNADVLSIASFFTGSNVYLAQPGFQKLPSGLMIQWGYSSLQGDTTGTFNYPTSFTTETLSINATLGAQLDGNYSFTVGIDNVVVTPKSQFRVTITTTFPTSPVPMYGFNWLAIGY